MKQTNALCSHFVIIIFRVFFFTYPVCQMIPSDASIFRPHSIYNKCCAFCAAVCSLSAYLLVCSLAWRVWIKNMSSHCNGLIQFIEWRFISAQISISHFGKSAKWIDRVYDLHLYAFSMIVWTVEFPIQVNSKMFRFSSSKMLKKKNRSANFIHAWLM